MFAWSKQVRIGMIARGQRGLAGSAHAVEASGVKAFILPCNVVDTDAMEAAAEQAERDLNCSDVWSNIAMVSIFLLTEELTTISDQPTKKPRRYAHRLSGRTEEGSNTRSARLATMSVLRRF